MDVKDVLFRNIKPGKYYWLYSRRGPGDNAKRGLYSLKNGVVPMVLLGEIARPLCATGLRAVDATECRIVGWPDEEPIGGWVPVFGPAKEPDQVVTKVVTRTVVEKVPVPAEMVDGLPSLNGAKPPRALPAEYKRLFACYTKAGNLKAKPVWP